MIGLTAVDLVLSIDGSVLLAPANSGVSACLVSWSVVLIALNHACYVYCSWNV